MRVTHLLVTLLAIALVATLIPPAPQAQDASGPSGESAYNYDYVLTTQFPRRLINDEMKEESRLWIESQFRSFGLETMRQRIDITTWVFGLGQLGAGEDIRSPGYNIIATSPGTDPAAGWLVFGGHYDTQDGTSGGAADNSAGSAIVLELARYYASHPHRHNMQFILWDLEEEGTYGSAQYVAENIVGGPASFINNSLEVYFNLDNLGLNYPAIDPTGYHHSLDVNVIRGRLPVDRAAEDMTRSTNLFDVVTDAVRTDLALPEAPENPLQGGGVNLRDRVDSATRFYIDEDRTIALPIGFDTDTREFTPFGVPSVTYRGTNDRDFDPNNEVPHTDDTAPRGSYPHQHTPFDTMPFLLEMVGGVDKLTAAFQTILDTTVVVINRLEGGQLASIPVPEPTPLEGTLYMRGILPIGNLDPLVSGQILTPAAPGDTPPKVRTNGGAHGGNAGTIHDAQFFYPAPPNGFSLDGATVTARFVVTGAGNSPDGGIDARAAIYDATFGTFAPIDAHIMEQVFHIPPTPVPTEVTVTFTGVTATLAKGFEILLDTAAGTTGDIDLYYDSSVTPSRVEIG